jgi:hypothetical protein
MVLPGHVTTDLVVTVGVRFASDPIGVVPVGLTTVPDANNRITITRRNGGNNRRTPLHVGRIATNGFLLKVYNVAADFRDPSHYAPFLKILAVNLFLL